MPSDLDADPLAPGRQARRRAASAGRASGEGGLGGVRESVLKQRAERVAQAGQVRPPTASKPRRRLLALEALGEMGHASDAIFHRLLDLVGWIYIYLRTGHGWPPERVAQRTLDPVRHGLLASPRRPHERPA